MERALCRVPSRDRSECHNRQLAQETAGDGLGFPPLSASQTAWSNAESKPSCNPSWRRSASHPPLAGRASALYARGRECGRWLVEEYPRGRAASEQREPVDRGGFVPVKESCPLQKEFQARCVAKGAYWTGISCSTPRDYRCTLRPKRPRPSFQNVIVLSCANTSTRRSPDRIKRPMTDASSLVSQSLTRGSLGSGSS